MKVIASWGSSGAGKTAIALALAAQTAANKKDTLVICSESRTPALPIYLPAGNFTANNSLGAVLESSENFTDSILKDKIINHPKSSHLYFMGLASGEIASITYKAPERRAVINLFHILADSPFSYVIVDCDSNPIYDSLTLYALETADVVMRVVTPDVKGYEFQKAQLAWLGSSDVFKTDRHTKIANGICDSTPVKEAATLFGGFDYVLPFAQEVKNKMAAGELLHSFHTNLNAIKFEDHMKQLAATVMED